MRYEEIIKTNEPMFTDIFRNCKNGYMILQLPLDVPYKFRSYEEVKICQGIEPERDKYHVVYAEEVTTDKWKTEGTLRSICDYVYMCFNHGTYPDNYYGTSVSVSDVLVIKVDGVVRAFYVDYFGYKEVPKFANN